MLLHTITNVSFVIIVQLCHTLMLVSVFFREMFNKWWLSQPELASPVNPPNCIQSDALWWKEMQGDQRVTYSPYQKPLYIQSLQGGLGGNT